MARELLNTLFVTTQGAYVHLDNETLRVEVEERNQNQGTGASPRDQWYASARVSVSPAAMAKCAEDQRDLVFLSRSGRFRAKVIGPTPPGTYCSDSPSTTPHRTWPRPPTSPGTS